MRAAEMDEATLASGVLTTNVQIVHKFSDAVECNVTVTMGGTESQRLLVVTIRRKWVYQNIRTGIGSITEHIGCFTLQQCFQCKCCFPTHVHQHQLSTSPYAPTPAMLSQGATNNPPHQLCLISPHLTPHLCILCRRVAADLMFCCDTHGRIVYCTTALAHFLNYEPRELVKTNMCDLLPPPFKSLHQKWMKNPPAKVPLNSCRGNSTVTIVPKGKASVPVRCTINQREVNEQHLFVVILEPSSFEVGTNWARLPLLMLIFYFASQLAHAPICAAVFGPDQASEHGAACTLGQTVQGCGACAGHV